MAFKSQLQLRVEGWRLDCSNDRSQVSYSCLGVRLMSKPAHAQGSLIRESCLSVISFFSQRELTISVKEV